MLIIYMSNKCVRCGRFLFHPPSLMPKRVCLSRIANLKQILHSAEHRHKQISVNFPADKVPSTQAQPQLYIPLSPSNTHTQISTFVIVNMCAGEMQTRVCVCICGTLSVPKLSMRPGKIYLIYPISTSVS